MNISTLSNTLLTENTGLAVIFSILSGRSSMSLRSTQFRPANMQILHIKPQRLKTLLLNKIGRHVTLKEPVTKQIDSVCCYLVMRIIN